MFLGSKRTLMQGGVHIGKSNFTRFTSKTTSQALLVKILDSAELSSETSFIKAGSIVGKGHICRCGAHLLDNAGFHAIYAD